MTPSASVRSSHRAPPRADRAEDRQSDRDEALIASYLRAFRTVEEEVDAPLRITEGALPNGLRGILYRNGPGRLERGGRSYGHPFDGDGMITRFAFGDGGVRYRNRFVRTTEFCAEERAGRILYRGFGTLRPGGLLGNALRLRFKNAANTGVVLHGGKLLALWEGGLPHRLDPETLDTLGPDDLGGALRNRGGLLDRLLAPELPFSAHPKLDPETGELWNFGVVAAKESRLALYRVGRDGRVLDATLATVPHLAFVHDFVLTARHRVFFLCPAAFDLGRTLLGLASPAGSLHGQPGVPTWILLAPRDGGPQRLVQASSCFLFHFAGGHDAADGRVVVQGMRMADLPAATDGLPFEAVLRRRFPAPILTRYSIDAGGDAVTEEPLTDHPGELPTVNPARFGAEAPHRYVWAIGAAPGEERPIFTRVLRVDTAERRTTSLDFGADLPGEPLFVPRPGATAEDDGWLLTLVYVSAAHRTDLVVLSARDLSVVCRAALPHHVPPGFHGTFVPAGAAAAAGTASTTAARRA